MSESPPAGLPALPVVAAILTGARPGELLAFQRPPNKRHGGLWELPGGKVDPGEGPREALCRELKEELGVQAAVGSVAWSGLVPGTPPLAIGFYPCRVEAGTLVLREHTAMRSLTARALEGMAWAPGDVPFVQWLLAEPGRFEAVLNAARTVGAQAESGQPAEER